MLLFVTVVSHMCLSPLSVKMGIIRVPIWWRLNNLYKALKQDLVWSKHAIHKNLSSYVCCSFAKWCLTLCNPLDYTVHGILQARILEWVAFPFSKGSSQPWNQTVVSLIAGRFFSFFFFLFFHLFLLVGG